MSQGGAIELWWATTDEVGHERLTVLAEQLDPATRAAARKLVRAEDRARTVVAHTLARRLIAARTGVAPGELKLERRCAACGATDHGKPAFAGAEMPEFSISHAGPLVVVAVGPALAAIDGAPGQATADRPQAGAIGVDVELPGRGDWELVRRHTFTEAEWSATAATQDPAAARLLLWSAKEAASKATGHGLELGLARMELAEPFPHPGGAWQAATLASPPAGAPPDALTGLPVALAALPSPLAGASLVVATVGAGPAELPALHDGAALIAGDAS